MLETKLAVGSYQIPININSNILSPGEHVDIFDILEHRREITDETGVPLSSDRVSPPIDIDFEYTKCPYLDSPTRSPGGRPGKIPMSGLERDRLRQSFPEIRRSLLAIRAGYISMLGLEQDKEFTVEDGLNVLSIIQGLPTYLTERSAHSVPINDSLPQHFIVGSNASSGAMAAIGAYAQGRPRIIMPEGDVLLHAAETLPGSGLVGKLTVCAAAPSMIKQYLDLVRQGSQVVEFGSVEDETSGLLTTKELGNALLLGVHLESLHGINNDIFNSDCLCLEVLEKYNHRKHNPKKARRAYEDFIADLKSLIPRYDRASYFMNVALGRTGEREGEFDKFIETNPLNLRSFKLARDKKLGSKAVLLSR